MNRLMAVEYNSSPGYWAKSIRVALNLTQKELADMAGITLQEVCLFEKNYPVMLGTRRKLLRILWAARRVVKYKYSR